MIVVVGANSVTPPTSITYNGVAMSFLLTQKTGTQSNWIHVYILASPATGAKTLAITYGNNLGAIALSYSGVKTTGQPEVTTQEGVDPANGVSQNSITTISDNSWAIALWGANASPVSLSNITRRASNANAPYAGDSNSAITPAGSFTQNESTGGQDHVAFVQLAIAPVVSGPANLKTINGLSKASIKTINGLAIASVKSFNGLT
jgi:hypothetical protein